MRQPYDEAFWINQVERNISIGWEKSSIPTTSFTQETADVLAGRLNAQLDVLGDRYVFIKTRGN